MRGHPLSPVKHLYLREEKERAVESELLEQIVKEVRKDYFVILFQSLITFICISFPVPIFRSLLGGGSVFGGQGEKVSQAQYSDHGESHVDRQ